MALAWLLAQDGVIVIPKAGDVRHVEENQAPRKITLTARQLAELDLTFPRPRERRGLEML